MKISIILLWITVIIEAFFIFYLSRFIIIFLKKFRVNNSGGISIDELLIGEKAPLFREIDSLQREIALSDNKGNHTLLIFLSNSCSYCKEIASNLSIISTNYPQLRIIVISKEDIEGVDFSSSISVIKSSMLLETYKIRTTPTILLLDTRNHLINFLNTQHSHGLNILIKNYFNNSQIA